MTSTNIFVGLAEDGKSSIKVPNAPRGCIGEIFSDNQQSGSKSGGNCPDTPSRPRDTHSRLFGAVAPSNGGVRDNLRSNISFGSDEKRPGSSTSSRSNGNGSINGNGNHHGHAENGQSNGHHMHSNGQSNGHAASPAKANWIRRNPVTGDGIGYSKHPWNMRYHREAGNPITGDGYKTMNGEINTSVTALNGSPAPILHNKVPPGGYSSGLW